MASGTSDRVIAGRIRCASKSRSPPSPTGAYIPVPGSHPSRTEKPMISSSPTQNAGMLIPIIATTCERLIDPRAGPGGRQHAQQHAERKREQEGAAGQHQGGVESSPQLRQHGPAQHDRAAEVAVDRASHPPSVLHQHGLVEAELTAQVGQLGRGRHRAQQDLGRIAGSQVEREEHDEGDADEDEERGEEAVRQVASHARTPRV